MTVFPHTLVLLKCHVFIFLLSAFVKIFLNSNWILAIFLYYQVTCLDHRRKSQKCPSVALMFQVGEEATYYNVSLN
jgi:hypothetical protein